jgi:HEAT repeat protein
MQALAKFKDPRGAAALSAWLASAPGQDDAAKALKEIGSVAAKEVAKFFNHPDGGARDRARDLLKEYGTGDDVLLVQSVQDLRGREVGRRKLAAEWLGTAKVNAARRNEAASALGELLKEKDEGAQEAAVRALVSWGNKGNVPALVALVEAEGFGHAQTMRNAAIEALGPLKDERGVIPVAKRLLDGNVATAREASKSLKAMGSIAEPAILTFLGNVNPNLRIEACRILEAIGTKESVKALTTVSRGRDRTVAQAATKALEAINARNK